MTQQRDPVLAGMVQGLTAVGQRLNATSKQHIFSRIGYIPLPIVDDLGVHESDKPNIIIKAGKGSGKSKVGEAEAAALATPEGSKGWIAGAEFKVSEKIYWPLWDMIERYTLNKVTFQNRAKHEMYFTNGGFVKAVSWENPDAIETEDLNWLIIDDAQYLTELVWRRLIARVRVNPTKIIILGSEDPDERKKQGKPYFDVLIETARQFPERWDVFAWGTKENQYYSPERLAQWRAELSEEDYLEIFEAVAKKPRSLVFRPFEATPGWHVKRLAEFDPSLPVWLAIDPGIASAYAVCFVQFHEQSPRVRVCDEVYERLPTDAVIDLCKMKPAWKNVVGGVVDRAGKTRELIHGDSVWSAWNKLAGIALNYVPKIIGIDDGTNRLMSFIRPSFRDANAAIPVADLAVHPRCRCLRAEFGDGFHPIAGMGPYMYQVNNAGEVMVGMNPIDRNNHAIKALIYLLVHRFGWAEGPIGKRQQRVTNDFSYMVKAGGL